jgi:hypothetical protein
MGIIMISARKHLEHLVGDIFGRHMAAAIVELAAAIDDEIEERVRNRVADLRAQLEQGESDGEH